MFLSHAQKTPQGRVRENAGASAGRCRMPDGAGDVLDEMHG
jgi:hypothetical protein